MPTNALLVRWHGGWREVIRQDSINAYGRRESLLGLGAVQSEFEVDLVAGSQLDIFGDVREEVDTEVAPMDEADTPYIGFRVGDRVTVPTTGGITQERVLAITVAEDANGEPTYATDLKDIILTEQETTLQTIKKMADGTLGGSSKVATPVSAISTTKDCCPPLTDSPSEG